MSDILVIYGSARREGDTLTALKATLGQTMLTQPNITYVDLKALDISGYDYTAKNQHDDFANVAEQMAAAKIILFATPVYWYAMSGVMKNFFDRFTDLITIRKPLGRALEGRNVYLLACGAGEELPKGFTEPFRATADYLNMRYRGEFYWCSRSTSPAQAKDAEKFGSQILNKLSSH